MKAYSIRTLSGGDVLFSGTFSSFKHCIEAAIQDQAPLHRADLRALNLSNFDLDGGDFRGASFSGSNLTGANLSECLLDDTNFSGATLFGTTLCESSIRNAHFDDVLFGATDIAYSDLSGSTFSTQSTFDLQFQGTSDMEGCRFINGCGTICPMSRPPVVVHGLVRILIFMDQHLKIGTEVYDISALPAHTRLGLMQPITIRTMLDKVARLCDRPMLYRMCAGGAE